MTTRARVLATAVAAVLLAVAAIGYALRARPDSAASAGTAGVPAGNRLVFLTNGVVSSVDGAAPAGGRELTGQECDLVSAGGETIACLRPVDALTATRLVIFDRDLRQRRELDGFTGFPNRLRVSASGRMVAWTMFVDGHSYASNGFSTQAGVLDTGTGTLIRSLEEFAVTLDGRPYRAADINVWGVTFTADDNRFYATMSTAGTRHLVEGDVAARTLRTLAPGVECPALSPDGTRIAFKSAVGGDPGDGWRLSVLELSSRRVTATAETRNVDDQAYWVDDDTVAYTLQRSDGTNDVWAVPADGGGQPAVLVPAASSPSLLPAGAAGG